MVASPPPAGIYVPVPTFFVSRQASSYNAAAPPVDVEAQVAHSVYLARAGIRGLVVLGSTGEAIHLSDEERKTTLSAISAGLKKEGLENYPIIAGTAAQNIPETVKQLRDASEAGAQYGLCLVPGYFAAGTTQDGIIAWFKAVADESPIPIMIYHYPGVSNNVKVAPSTYVTLAAHPNIVGCKLSHGDVSHHIQIASSPGIDHSKFHTFTGLGQHLLPVVTVGVAGAIDGCAGFFPKAVVALYELAAKTSRTEEETRKARDLQYRLSTMEEFVVQYGTVGIKDAISRLRSFGERDGTRLPLLGGLPGGDGEWARWQDAVQAMQEVEDTV